jgi:regulator of protease activity HflC (stomatin/prohibitin superfamily)
MVYKPNPPIEPMAAEDLLTICLIPVAVVIGFILLGSVKIIYEYQRSIVFTLGRFSGILTPGLNIVIPIVQTIRTVDMRIKTVDIPKQEVMTKDNVPVSVNAVVYFKVEDPKSAVLKIEDYVYAVSQYGQTALRDVIGNKDLDFVLTERENIANEIKTLVDKETAEWGVDITAIKVQDIELPADMKRAMARQAEAEREKRATIIRSEGEFMASENVTKAAARLGAMPGALHLRTLQTITDVGALDGNTILFVAPIELLRALEGLQSKKKPEKPSGEKTS